MLQSELDDMPPIENNPTQFDALRNKRDNLKSALKLLDGKRLLLINPPPDSPEFNIPKGKLERPVVPFG